MLNKLLLAGTLALAPIVTSQTASADHCGYGYGRSVAAYRVPPYGYYPNQFRPYGVQLYNSPGYRSYYGSRYRSNFGGPYGYGYPGYYGRGTSIGFGRGGVSLNFGF